MTLFQMLYEMFKIAMGDFMKQMMPATICKPV